jgi:hypothetical protein
MIFSEDKLNVKTRGEREKTIIITKKKRRRRRK